MAQTYQRDSQLLSLAWTCAQGVTAAFKGDNVWFVLLYCKFAVYTKIAIQSTHMYRKAIHTDEFLAFGRFHHLIQHKQSVVNALLDRVDKIPSTKAGRCKEHEHVLKVLAIAIVIILPVL